MLRTCQNVPGGPGKPVSDHRRAVRNLPSPHLVPHDGVARSDPVQPREECEDGVDDERDLLSQIGQDFATDRALQTSESSVHPVRSTNWRDWREPTQVTSFLARAAPPLARKSCLVSGILPSIPIPLTGHTSFSPLRSSSRLPLAPPDPRLLDDGEPAKSSSPSNGSAAGSKSMPAAGECPGARLLAVDESTISAALMFRSPKPLPPPLPVL